MISRHPAISPDKPRKPRSWSTYKVKLKNDQKTHNNTRSYHNAETEDNTKEINEDNEPDHEEIGESNSFDNYTRKADVPYPTQCAIVSKMHKGRSVTDISQIYHLTVEVINEIWEDRDEFVILKRAGRKSAKYMNSILDRRILDWFNYQKQNDVQVTGKMLMDIAETFAKECGFVAFNGSKKWLDRFKTRYSITFRSVRRKREFKNNPNESKWKRHFLEEQWLDARNGFTDEEIYTADEVGVYYNPSKGRIKKMAGKKYIHGFPKDRLAIFMCTNITGSDKKKLLVCGTDDPLVHSFRSPETLPVTYIRHNQGHFTTPMFEEFVKFWNRDLQLKNRKAILILDRATIHSKLTLSHLKLVFVPWKAANSLMPIKNGIFHRFRDEYRKLLVQEKAMNAVRGVDRNLTCLEALNLLEKAWSRTPSEVIANSFASTGYVIKNNCVDNSLTSPRVTDDDEATLCKMLSDFDVETYFHDPQTLDSYITVDEEFLTGHGSNGSVFGGNHKAVDPVIRSKEIKDILPLTTERPETDEMESHVVRTRALEDLEIVRSYLQRNGTKYEMFRKFMDVEKFVLNNSVSF